MEVLGTQVARLITAIQELSLARDLEHISEIVRSAARFLTGADGATFVLRDGDCCYYADEDAIAPLWKGKRFPMSACISGWVMHHAQAVVIEDIYSDPRIPADAYRPTFVKSLAIVPIRTMSPVGAIGNYWASHRRPTEAELALLIALADSTSIAMENVAVYAELESRVRDRTTELRSAIEELETFSYAVSHDLRSPLQVVLGMNELVVAQHGDSLPAEARRCIDQSTAAAERMSMLISCLLDLSRVGRLPVRRERTDLSAMVAELIAELQRREPREIDMTIAGGLVDEVDPNLIRVVLGNMVGNAWKYTGKTERPSIEFGRRVEPNGDVAYFVSDNGAGFDMARAKEVFLPFRRLHAATEFKGDGIGLSTAARIVSRHGGRVWCESEPGKGARFYFTTRPSARPRSLDLSRGGDPANVEPR